MTLERDIEAAIVESAKARGWLARKMVSVKGDPDRLFVKGGRAVVLEIKAPGKGATPLQRHRLNEWRLAGCPAYVVDGVLHAMDILDGVERRMAP